MWLTRLLSLAALLTLVSPPAADAGSVPHLKTVQLTPAAGYRTGDRITVEAQVALPDRSWHPVTEEAALPAWLELRETRMHPRRGTLDLQWVYQVFYVSPDGRAATLHIPKRKLLLEGRGQRAEILIPEQAFTLSPVAAADDTPAPDWQPEAPQWHGWPWAILGALPLAAQGYAWWEGRRKGLRFRPLCRKLAREPDPKAALRAVHRALDAKVGRVVLAPQDLLEAWPQAAAAQAQLERFFAASWATFYAHHADGPARTEALLLCEALARLERSS